MDVMLSIVNRRTLKGFAFAMANQLRTSGCLTWMPLKSNSVSWFIKVSYDFPPIKRPCQFICRSRSLRCSRLLRTLLVGAALDRAWNRKKRQQNANLPWAKVVPYAFNAVLFTGGAGHGVWFEYRLLECGMKRNFVLSPPPPPSAVSAE